MGWLPTARGLVVKVATPPLSVPVPMGEPLSWQVTVAPGVPEPGRWALTVAVKVTDCPSVDGLPDVTTAVVVLSWLIVCVTAPLAGLAWKLLSPWYTAVIEWLPSDSPLVLKVAWSLPGV